MLGLKLNHVSKRGHCCIILLILTADTIRMFSASHLAVLTLSFEDLYNCSFIIWLLQCVLNIVAMLWASHRQSAFPEFFVEWQIARNNCKERGSISKLIQRRYRVSVAGMGLIWASNFAIGTTLLYVEGNHSARDYPLHDSSPYTYVIRASSTVTYAYFTAAWVFPLGLTYFMCAVLCLEFSVLHECLMDFCKSKCSDANQLQAFRIKHQHLRSLVGHADDVLAWPNVFVFHTVENGRRRRGFQLHVCLPSVLVRDHHRTVGHCYAINCCHQY